MASWSDIGKFSVILILVPVTALATLLTIRFIRKALQEFGDLF